MNGGEWSNWFNTDVDWTGPCKTCKKRTPEEGHQHCIVCMAAYIEQERLKKQSFYTFFWILDNIGGLLLLGFFFHAGYSWHKHWVDSFFLDCVALTIVWNLHNVVARRTRGADSLEAQDRRNRV